MAAKRVLPRPLLEVLQGPADLASFRSTLAALEAVFGYDMDLQTPGTVPVAASTTRLAIDTFCPPGPPNAVTDEAWLFVAATITENLNIDPNDTVAVTYQKQSGGQVHFLRGFWIADGTLATGYANDTYTYPANQFAGTKMAPLTPITPWTKRRQDGSLDRFIRVTVTTTATIGARNFTPVYVFIRRPVV